MADPDLVHLHTHSDHSNFDGCGKLKDFINRAKEHGNPAIAFTEHGSIRQLTTLHEAATSAGIRPIYGVEFYLCSDMHRKGISPEEKAKITKGLLRSQHRQAIYEYERDAGILERFHLTVLAKNNVGLKNLCRATSLGWLKGYYKRPRIDLDCLEEHKEGLIVLSGCQSGSLGSGLVYGGDISKSIEIVDRLYHTFGEDFYAEIMPHNMKEQVKVNKGVMLMAKKLDLPLVTTQDAHWINPDGWKYQQAMLCINTRDVLANPERFKFGTNDFWLKGRKDLEETYRMFHGYLSKGQVKSSLDETLRIAEKCQAELKLDRFKALIPEVEVPSRFKGDEGKYLYHLCIEGWKKRDLDRLIADEAHRRGIEFREMRIVYLDRLAREVQMFEARKVTRYFLVVWDLYNWVRNKDIEVGPGRGSVGGCLAAFLLGITDVDPVRFNLLFERFLSPARVDMPDIDMDFQDDRREEIIQHLRDTYGEDRTVQIGTNGKMTGKACLKDIGRIMGIPIREIQPIADLIEATTGDREHNTIEDAFASIEECQRFDQKYPQVLEYAKNLEGQVKTLGVHAAGVVVAPEPIIDLCPLEVRKDKVCTAIDMYGVADLGLMKLDVLGLRNLTSMQRCRAIIEERYGKKIDWLSINLEDRRVLNRFTSLDFKGIFQYDTHSAYKICEGVNFTKFDDIAAMIALNRPGTSRSGLAAEYLKRKKDPKAIESIHPIVDSICSDTLGVIVYQEHVQRIFSDLAGFDQAKADTLRRKIAKKYGADAIAEVRAEFVDGAKSRGMDEKTADKLISQIAFFGGYGFNRAHSVEYALIAYRQMWLKAYYPIEFMWALLDVEPGRDEVISLVRYCGTIGIDVRSADINSKEPGRWSIKSSSVTDDVIVGSLIDVKGIGKKAIEEIKDKGPFSDFVDFCARVNRRRMNKRAVKVLIQAGAFNLIVPNPRWLFENVDELWQLIGKGDDWESDIYRLLASSHNEEQWSAEDEAALAAEVNPLSAGADPFEPYAELLGSMRDDWIEPGSLGFWGDNRSGFVYGRVSSVKFNKIGDFHDGPEPDELDRRRKGWGKRYATIDLEGVGGRSQRMKLDPDVLESMGEELVDSLQSSVIAAHVVIRRTKMWKSCKASYVVDLSAVKRKLDNGDELSLFELSMYKGWYPGGKKKKPGRGPESLATTALVSRVMEKVDKNGGEMAFLGLLCADGSHREAVCFASSWPGIRGAVSAGGVFRFRLKVDGKSLILNERATPVKE